MVYEIIIEMFLNLIVLNGYYITMKNIYNDDEVILC